MLPVTTQNRGAGGIPVGSQPSLRPLARPTTGNAVDCGRSTNTGRGGASTFNILNGRGATVSGPSRTGQLTSFALPRTNVPRQPNALGGDLPGFKTSFNTASKGGGSFRPIGTNGQASFNVNPANGTLRISVPIHTSSARGNFGPELQLAYDSGSGNGPFGIGWHLPLAAVSRKTAECIPVYRPDTDEFSFGGSDLVPWLQGDEVDVQIVGGFRITRYRPRIDPQSMRIEKWARIADDSDVHWRAISSDNVTSIYGETDACRIFDSTGRKRVFSWLLTRTVDSFGNAASYIYKPEDGLNLSSNDGVLPIWEQNRPQEARCRQKYLKRILYGNITPARDLDTWNILPVDKCPKDWMFEVVFDYGEHDTSVPRTIEDTTWTVRQDPFSTANSGFEIRTYRLCRRILMFHHLAEEPNYPYEILVSSTSLIYNESGQGTFLASATASGHTVAKMDKERRIATSYNSQSLPPSTFMYTTPPDLRQTKALRANIANLADIPRPGSLAEWLDLDGEGIPGLLTRSRDGTLSYQRNNGKTTFSAPEVLGHQPSLGRSQDGQFIDLDRNGRLDLVCTDGNGQLLGFYERQSDSDTWSEYSDFPATPVSESHPAVHIDLTGSGVADVLLQQGEVDRELVWQQSLGKQGLSGERRVSGLDEITPWHISAEAQHTYVADMTGDGLTDLVRIGTAGKITYFPNHGYGTFGRPIEMGSPPVIESFDAERVRFIDVDGSGPMDLVYILPGGGVHLYFNQAGNSWSAPLLISKLPRIVNPSSVFVLDLLGQGTACLCWHSSVGNGPVTTEIKYIDLMGGSKPHLLKSYENGMGAMTSVSYAPSTRFYLEDKASGKPWTTRLPFPVQCVAGLVSQDCITGSKSTTEYKYHNGCYDGFEKSFAGFEFVETWVRGSVYLGDEGVYQAPESYTRSWHHVGLSLLLDESQFCTPSHLSSAIKLRDTPILTREALVALRGNFVRIETYGLDGSAEQHLPYTVQERSYDVEQLQKHEPGKTLHAVFQVTPRSSLNTDFERSLEDGRITQEVVLASTPWGDITQSLVISYPRTSKYMHDITYEDVKTSQGAGHVVMNKYDYTNAIVEDTTCDLRAFRRPVPWKHQIFEISSFPFRGSVISVDELRSLDPENWPRTLLSDERALFRNSELNDTLDPGKIEAFSVPSQSFSLAFTDEIVAKIVAGQEQCGITKDTAPDLMLDKVLQEGGYIQLDDEHNWWQPSSRVAFAERPEVELFKSRRTFYQPTIIIDPFGNRSTVTLDKYCLMAKQVTDALGNNIVFENDYSLLQPVKITDANQNTQSVLLNPLGDAIAFAVLGKAGHTTIFDDVDSLDGMDPYIGEHDVEAILKDPSGPVSRRVLGNAGSRIIRVLDAFVKSQKPTFTITITRDRSFQQADEAVLHVVVTYTQGSGSVLQTAALDVDDKSSEVKWLISGYEGAAPIRNFDPFFADSPAFVPIEKCTSNVSTSLTDVLGRSVAHITPDHAWSKIVHTPWKVVLWHQTDTLMITDPKTDPDVGHLFSRIASSRYLPTWLQQKEPDSPSVTQSKLYTSQAPITTYLSCNLAAPQVRSTHKAGDGRMFTLAFGFDAMGNQTHSWDTLERLAEMALYDSLGRPIQARSMDAGDKWAIQDVSGAQIISWNSRGVCNHRKYDPLRREIECWSLVMPLSPSKQKVEAQLVVQTQFGESCGSDADAIEANLRGRLWKTRDQSGEHTKLLYDIRGRPIRDKYQPALEYKAVLDWGTKRNTQLDSRSFEINVKFDNFGHLVWEMDSQGNEIRRVFSRLGKATRVEFRHIKKKHKWQRYLTNAIYEADGLPSSITYGNGTRTTYTYHPQSRYLLTQRTVALKPGSRKENDIKEDLSFAYDIAGHRISKSNKAERPVFTNGTRISPVFSYSYDAVGQLLSATGRAHLPTGASQLQPHSVKSGNTESVGPADPDRLYNYQESYTYDLAGNMTRMRHEALGGVSVSGWTRRFYYEEPSSLSGDGKVMGNKLSRTTVGKKEQRYTGKNDMDDECWPEGGANESGASLNDASRAGCMTSLPGYALLHWNAENRLAAASTQRVNHGTPSTTYYVYDYAGNRVRKVTESDAVDRTAPPRKQRETFFLGRIELNVIASGRKLQRWVATVESGNGERVALVETDDSSAQLVRYQIGENLELDEEGRLISYEECSPFGSPIYTTAAREIQARREYRFSRYRWDRETGLFACGARYYCPWLGRWTAPDPLGDVDGPNLYVYVGNDPVNFHDPLGTHGDPKGGVDTNLNRQGVEAVVKARNLFTAAKLDKAPHLGRNASVGIILPKIKSLYGPNYERGTLSSLQAGRGTSERRNNNSNNIPNSGNINVDFVKNGKPTRTEVTELSKKDIKTQFYLKSPFKGGPGTTYNVVGGDKKVLDQMEKDLKLAGQDLKELNTAFKIMERNLRVLSETLYQNRIEATGKSPNQDHKKTIANHLEALKGENIYAGFASADNPKRYEVTEKAIDGMANFAKRHLGSNLTPEMVQGLKIVTEQRNDIWNVWRSAVRRQEITHTNSHNHQTSFLIQKIHSPR